MLQKFSTMSMYGHDGTLHHVVCILCYTDHNQYHKTFSCNKDSLCVLSSACPALNFRHIESVLMVLHTLTIFYFCQTQNGYSPVYVASQNGHTEVVDLLVQAGADINLASTDEVHVSTHTVSSSVAAVVETNVRLINPRHACAVRVTVVWSVCVCVCVCVSVYLLSHISRIEHLFILNTLSHDCATGTAHVSSSQTKVRIFQEYLLM